MRNYIILNNQRSDEISGLIIQELASISKPLQRTQVETIDGRDGDIITPLGYAAYNKKIKIGLYGTFDINEIIAYFATEGQVVFSNEPDKYYNYQIVDQIDYERLVRYRVATVTMHVQPFKYSATEGTITVDSSDTVSGEGSDIALDGTAEAPFNVLRHKGNATQKTYSGKNLISTRPSSGSQNGITWTLNQDGSVKVSGTATATQTIGFGSVSMEQGKTYTLSGCPSGGASGKYMLYTNVVDPQFQDYGAGSTHTVSTSATAQIYFIVYGGRTVDGTIYPQLELGSQASSYEQYVGGSPSPNPDYPQDIQVITGDSTVKITGKNLANLPTDTSLPMDSAPYTIIDFGKDVTFTSCITTFFFKDAKYTNASGALVDFLKNDGTHQYRTTPSFRNTSNVQPPINTVFSGAYSNPNNNLTFRKLNVYLGSGYAGWTQGKVNIQLELGNQASQFEPHKEQSYVLPFGDTYLAAIGDYADEPVKVGDTWYIRRAVGKVVLDGSSDENWGGINNNACFYTPSATDCATVPTSTVGAIMSDYFTATTYGNLYASSVDYGTALHSGSHYLLFRDKDITTVADFKTWLASHPTTVYYALATPTDEAITDQDLIDALDEFYDQAHAYKGHTHITATAADGNAPAVLAVEVGEDNESTVTNAGNTTSRPILTIYGQGDIGVYINDVEVLDIELGDEGYITLDSVEMEAYKDNTANLKNRLVTGDYSKLALNAGANKIRFTGAVTKYEISKYSRWL